MSKLKIVLKQTKKSPKFEENLENLKNRATQLLIKYKSEALVTQYWYYRLRRQNCIGLERGGCILVKREGQRW